MKKILAIICAGIITCSIAACGGEPEEANNPETTQSSEVNTKLDSSNADSEKDSADSDVNTSSTAEEESESETETE